MRGRVRSVSLAITLASISVALSIALLVGWTLVIGQNLTVSGPERPLESSTWLLVLGLISFAIIMGVLIAFAVFLVGQIREVRRQYSFIDSVTHELKSPLASIKLLLETLQREGITEEQQDKLRRMMLADVERLSIFIDDILEAGRMTHGQYGSPLVDVDLRTVLERSREAVAGRYPQKPHEIDIHMDNDITMYTDKTALEVVVKNLLDNAVKYSQDDDVRVSIDAALDEKKERAVIEVKDHGIGIDRKDLKRIFQRFYRVPEEAVRQRRGTGIGLHVVRGLVSHLGGKLHAHSEGLGQGTSMVITVPLNLKAPAKDKDKDG